MRAVVITLVCSLLLAFGSLTITHSALAQGETTCDPAEACADSESYPGPFVNVPTTPALPDGTTLMAPSPIAAPVDPPADTPADPPAEQPLSAQQVSADAGAAAGNDLAQGGTSSYVLAYLGTGMLAFGLVSLGLRRSARAFAD